MLQQQDCISTNNLSLDLRRDFRRSCESIFVAHTKDSGDNLQLAEAVFVAAGI